MSGHSTIGKSCPYLAKKAMTKLLFIYFQIHVVIQDVNDNSPVFTQKNYYATVAENAQLHPPAAVLQVNAIDADESVYGEVKYEIVGNENKLFQLDSNSGILYPSQSLKGKKGQYKLTVEARDGLGFGPNSDTTDVVIDIQSVNNYRPVFIMPALSNASVEVQEVISAKFISQNCLKMMKLYLSFNLEPCRWQLFGNDGESNGRRHR